MNAAQMNHELYMQSNILLVENMTLVEDSEDIVNWLLPLGAGRGDAILTLEKSTRGSLYPSAIAPFPIGMATMGDGRSIPYIHDPTSLALNGTIQFTGTFKNIAPISNSEADQIAAANALYDAAAASLKRSKDKYDSYSITCRKIDQNLYPGDKIHVRYEGFIVNAQGEVVDYRDINGDFWILDVSETYGGSGNQIRMTIASVDRYEMDMMEVVLGALEEIKINNVSVEPYFSKDAWKDSFEIDATHPVTFTIDITNATQQVQRCILRLRTTPFRSTAQGSAAGGDHVHQVFSTPSGTYGGATTLQAVTAADGPPPSGLTTIALQMVNANNPIFTYGASGEHVHPMQYGIQDDDKHPKNVSIYINGVDRSAALGGTWAAGGSSLNLELNITDFINAAPNLQQSHTIEIRCTDGQGLVKVHCELWEIVQSIAVFD